MTMTKRITSILLAVICIFSMFAFIAPIEAEAASAYKVTKISGYFQKYTANFNKDIHHFSDSVVVKTNNYSGNKMYMQISYRINGGSWKTYDANKVIYDDDVVISYGQNLKSKTTKIEYRFRTYTLSGRTRTYGAWSSIVTYKLSWSRPWYQIYSNVSITCSNNGLTKNYKTFIR